MHDYVLNLLLGSCPPVPGKSSILLSSPPGPNVSEYAAFLPDYKLQVMLQLCTCMIAGFRMLQLNNRT